MPNGMIQGEEYAGCNTKISSQESNMHDNKSEMLYINPRSIKGLNDYVSVK